jgi:flagellar protein FlaF
MYMFSYDEAMVDGGASQRGDEKLALRHSISLLNLAEQRGVNSREAVEALFFINRLWSFFIDDLMKPDNALPAEVRASLISVGIWLLRETEAIGAGNSDNFKGLIEVSELIAEGLK